MDTMSSECWKQRVNKEIQAQTNFANLINYKKLKKSKSTDAFADSVRRIKSIDCVSVASYYQQAGRLQPRETMSTNMFVPSNPNTIRANEPQRTFIYTQRYDDEISQPSHQKRERETKSVTKSTRKLKSAKREKDVIDIQGAKESKDLGGGKSEGKLKDSREKIDEKKSSLLRKLNEAKQGLT